MRMIELIKPKQPVDDGYHAVLKRIKDLYDKGIPKGDILMAVRREFGSDVLKAIDEHLEEAINTAPDTIAQRKSLAKLFDQPIPVEQAQTLLAGLIDDDALRGEFDHAEPGTDARPIIKQWIQLNLPFLFNDKDEDLMGAGEGIFSPLHGYDLENSEE